MVMRVCMSSSLQCFSVLLRGSVLLCLATRKTMIFWGTVVSFFFNFSLLSNFF